MPESNPNRTRWGPHPDTIQHTPPSPAIASDTLKPQTVTIPSYGLNHPKAYVAYPIALSLADANTSATNQLITDYVIGTPNKARLGAMNLGLVTAMPNTHEYQLTDAGRHLCQHATSAYGSLQTALEAFDDLRGSSTRFCSLDAWTDYALLLPQKDTAATHLIELLQTIHRERRDESEEGPTLAELVVELYYEDPAFAFELFITDSSSIRGELIDSGTLNYDLLEDKRVYRGAASYQFKNLLYHCGYLTETGSDTVSLDPTEETWALEVEHR